eukprot:1820643-Pyramimonas_sp.AAC.1
MGRSGACPAVPALRDNMAWPLVLAKLKQGAAVRWNDVRGPIAALQATLIQAGWDPQSPLVWSRPLSDGAIDDWIVPAS